MSTEVNHTQADTPKAAKPQEVTHSSKKKYENVWRIFLVMIIVIAGALFHKVYVFQTHPAFQGIREGNVTEMLIYGLPFAVLYTIVDWLIHYCLDDLCEKYYITEKKYADPEARKKRCYTLVKWGYSCIYYLISSLWAYGILKQTNFLPIWLGGKGTPYSMLEVAPKVSDVTFQMKVFYIIQFGKHFSRFFSHVFIRPQGNFFEYALHHGLSTFLIIFSYLTNQWLIGIFVLLVHDYSDFGLTLGRGYKEYKFVNKIILDFTFIHGFIAWFGCRIVLFIIVCILPSIYVVMNVGDKFSQFQLWVLYFPYVFMTFMMICLEIMHMYWTYFIVQSFVAVKISSKLARHTYD